MPEKKNNQINRELLEEILSEIQSMQQELLATKSAITEIRCEITKLNQLENKLQKGENIATANGGWFFWS